MMRCEESKSLVDAYISWLRDEISFDEVDGACEITTPFLDRHNDSIVIYLVTRGNDVILTDDGYILADLALSGVTMTDKRRKVMTTILNGFGVQLEDDEITVQTSVDNFPRKKHALIQALLAVNDMFMMGQQVVRALFLEEVVAYFKEHEVRFNQSLKIAGKSSMDHVFDFIIPASQKAPERLVQTVGRPSKDTVVGKILFPHLDIKETRLTDFKLYGLLNDADKVSTDIINSIRNVGVTPVLWSERDLHIEELMV